MIFSRPPCFGFQFLFLVINSIQSFSTSTKMGGQNLLLRTLKCNVESNTVQEMKAYTKIHVFYYALVYNSYVLSLHTERIFSYST